MKHKPNTGGKETMARTYRNCGNREIGQDRDAHRANWRKEKKQARKTSSRKIRKQTKMQLAAEEFDGLPEPIGTQGRMTY